MRRVAHQGRRPAPRRSATVCGIRVCRALASRAVFARLALVMAVLLAFAGCRNQSEESLSEPAEPWWLEAQAKLEERVPGWIEEHRVAGVGIALINEGAIVWEAYFGERAAGEPVTPETMFNVASVAKTVTAEVTLRLADEGRIDLDEPIAEHWTEPDLADDPRYGLLTPRIVLSHRTGLLNWAYAYDDGRLAFVADPGERLTYSGAGYEMLVHFIEAKLGQDFESLARETLFEPFALDGISLSRRDWIDARIPDPMDADGRYQEPYTYPGTTWVRPVGYYDGADDLYVTVNDYARFLLAVMDGEGLSEELVSERLRVVADASGAPGWECALEPPERCPRPYGYGLGWTVFGFGERTFVQHGGADFGEHAMVYFVPETREGLVVFVNGGNGMWLVLDALESLEPSHPLAAHFRARLNALGIEP